MTDDWRGEQMLRMFNAKRTSTGRYTMVENTPITFEDIQRFVTKYDKEDATKLLIISIFNRRDEIRQRAAEALGDIQHPGAIRFLLYAFSDPDVAVSIEALLALKKYFKDEYRPVFIAELAFLSRTIGVTLHPSVKDFMLNKIIIPEFYGSLSASDRGRRLYLTMYLEVHPFNLELAELMIKDRCDLIRAEAMKHFNKLPNEKQKEFLEKLKKDPSTFVRRAALSYSK